MIEPAKAELAITPEMIEAGEIALANWDQRSDLAEWIVTDVYQAMVRARRLDFSESI